MNEYVTNSIVVHGTLDETKWDTSRCVNGNLIAIFFERRTLTQLEQTVTVRWRWWIHTRIEIVPEMHVQLVNVVLNRIYRLNWSHLDDGIWWCSTCSKKRLVSFLVRQLLFLPYTILWFDQKRNGSPFDKKKINQKSAQMIYLLRMYPKSIGCTVISIKNY